MSRFRLDRIAIYKHFDIPGCTYLQTGCIPSYYTKELHKQKRDNLKQIGLYAAAQFQGSIHRFKKGFLTVFLMERGRLFVNKVVVLFVLVCPCIS